MSETRANVNENLSGADRFDRGIEAWRQELIDDLRCADLPTLADAFADPESPFAVHTALVPDEVKQLLAQDIRVEGHITYHGWMGAEMLAHPCPIVWSKKPTGSDDGWQTFKDGVTVGGMLNSFGKFTPRESKGGCGFTQYEGRADAKGKRLNSSAARMVGIMFDTDNGKTVRADVISKAKARGWALWVYDSYSNGKTTTELVNAKLIKAFNGCEPSEDGLRDYLIEEKGLAPWVVEKIDYTFDVGNLKTIVTHAPIPKARYAVWLQVPFEVDPDVDENGTVVMVKKTGKPRYDTAARDWLAKVVLPVSQALGIDPDPVCKDLARFLYVPTCPIGSDNHRMDIVAGGPVDWRELPPVELAAPAPRKYATGLKSTATRGMKKSFPQPWLGAFWKEHAHHLRLAQIALDATGDDRGDVAGKQHVKCPMDHLHSNEDDPDDHGFWCRNPEDAEPGKDGVQRCFAECEHTHGKEPGHHLTTDYLSAFCEMLNITDWRQLQPYVDLQVGEEFTLDSYVEPFASYEEFLAAAEAVQKIEDDTKLLVAEKVAERAGMMVPELSPGQKQTGKNKLCPLISGRKHPVGMKSKDFDQAYEKGRKARQSQAEPADRREETDAGLPEDFSIEGDWVGIEKTSGESTRFTEVCRKFRNVGFLTDETGHGLGHLLEFVDENGVKREVAYEHSETVSDAGAFLRRLAKANMRFRGGEEPHKLACVMFADMPNGDPILNASRAGWHVLQGKRIFIPMVGAVIGAQTMPVRLQEKARVSKREPTGSIEGWQGQARAVMNLCDFHSTVLLSSAFAGPILSLLRLPSCGIAPTGGTSIGKSLVMKYGAAIWGLVREGAGAFIDLRGSDNGMEGIAYRLTGHTGMLDEFRNMSPKARQNVIFMLAHELSKTRADTDQGLRARLTWSLFFVISAEKEISKLIEEGGESKAGGAERRLVEIDCTGAKSSQDSAEVNRLEMGVDDNCGWVGPAFVEWLFGQGYADDPAPLEQRVNEAQVWLLGDGGHSGVMQAAARTVAIAYVAGKLAIEADLLPMVEGRDIDADFREAWGRSMGDKDRLSVTTAEGAVAALEGRINDLWGRYGVTVSLKDDAEDGADPYVLECNPNGEKLFYSGPALVDQDGKPYMVVRTDKQVDGWAGGAVKHKALIEELEKQRRLIPMDKSHREWRYLPKACGGGVGRNIRFRIEDSGDE